MGEGSDPGLSTIRAAPTPVGGFPLLAVLVHVADEHPAVCAGAGNLRHRGVLEEKLKNYRLKQNFATGYAAFEPLRDGQHDDLLFATCLGVWASERAIHKEEYRSFPGEHIAEVPINVIGRGR